MRAFKTGIATLELPSGGLLQILFSAGLALMLPCVVWAEDLSLRILRIAGEGTVSHNTPNSPLPSLSFSIPGSRGGGSDSVSYGGVDLDMFSTSSSTSYGGQISGSATINRDFTVSTASALNGSQGTINFSTRLSGGFGMTSAAGYAHFSVNQYLGGYYASIGVLDPQSPNSTIATVQPIAFNSGGAVVTIQTNVSGVAQANSPDNGFPDTRAHVNLSVRTGAIAVLDGNGGGVNFTSTSLAGTARGSNVASGVTLTGFSLTNNAAHQTTMSLLDGSAGGATLPNGGRYLQAAFLASPNFDAGLTAVSDAVDFAGTVNDKFVIQIAFDEAAVLAAGLTDAALHLEWLDPLDGTFKDAYKGNSDHGAASKFIPGPYLSAIDFQLGNFGVDPLNHTLWAVVDHNSEFVVGSPQVIPEPSALLSVLTGGGLLLLCRFRRASSASV